MKVGACRALSQLLPEANKGLVQPHMMSLFTSLANLLRQVLLCKYIPEIIGLILTFISCSIILLHRHLKKLYTWYLKRCRQQLRQVGMDTNVNITIIVSSFNFFCCLPHCLYLLVVAHEASAVVESIVSPVILHTWALHISDPFISIDAIDVLEVTHTLLCICFLFLPVIISLLSTLGAIYSYRMNCVGDWIAIS